MVQFLICPSHSHPISSPNGERRFTAAVAAVHGGAGHRGPPWTAAPATVDGGAGHRGRWRRPPWTVAPATVDGGGGWRRRRSCGGCGKGIFVIFFYIYFTFPPLPFYTKHFQFLPTLHPLNYFSFSSQFFPCKTLSFTYPKWYQTDPKLIDRSVSNLILYQ